jgi:ATP-dependent Clp protease adaptor protein ClpS
MGDVAKPPGEDSSVKTKKKVEAKKPEMYKVVLLNDDFTPREFVVELLKKVFRRSTGDAKRIMLTAHTSGKATVGTYTYDIATTKVSEARRMAKDAGYPLRFKVEGA